MEIDKKEIVVSKLDDCAYDIYLSEVVKLSESVIDKESFIINSDKEYRYYYDKAGRMMRTKKYM